MSKRINLKTLSLVICCILLCCVSAVIAAGQEQDDENSLFTPPRDLAENVPDHFPRFFFEGDQEKAQLLSRFLWHHFSTRLSHPKTTFEQEYMTLSDMWLGGAHHPGWPRRIQKIHRDNLLGIELSPSGYVHTHQHWSHAHEHGWPFPIWTQVPGGVAGVTAGWHFKEQPRGWVWNYLRNFQDAGWLGQKAAASWELNHIRSLGIKKGRWHLESTGNSPTIISPEGVVIDSYNAPFLQLRWTRSGEPPKDTLPYVEWKRMQDKEFSSERRVYFGFESGNPDYERVSGTTHSMMTMYRHPKWAGKIKRMRVVLAPDEKDVDFTIDSFFTVYDTRHSVNNTIYILGCWNYFRWTRDLPFLRQVIKRMRRALRYHQRVMQTAERGYVYCPWVGHDGRSGLDVKADGSKKLHPGHGIGSNYWDLLPFGASDMYASSQYHAAVEVMAKVEQAVAEHPEWDVPRGKLAFDPEELRQHAEKVKTATNRKFWNEETGRFVAAEDRDGTSYDYGFTFVNLESIWYGVASESHRQAIMDWITGDRIVAGDTSTGEDIYRWRFGPRSTTKRNVEWYAFVWTHPENIPWGGQVQDGGAVLGFSFFDLWARLDVLGADNAWERLSEILEWEKDVWAAGGYREYYKGGKRGTTLQGAGKPGGLGIDKEFFESIMVPSIVVYGFMGLDPAMDSLKVRPRLPEGCPWMGVSDLLYDGVRLDVETGQRQIRVAVKDDPDGTIIIDLGEGWITEKGDRTGPEFVLDREGVYAFLKRNGAEE